MFYGEKWFPSALKADPYSSFKGWRCNSLPFVEDLLRRCSGWDISLITIVIQTVLETAAGQQNRTYSHI